VDKKLCIEKLLKIEPQLWRLAGTLPIGMDEYKEALQFAIDNLQEQPNKSKLEKASEIIFEVLEYYRTIREKLEPEENNDLVEKLLQDLTPLFEPLEKLDESKLHKFLVTELPDEVITEKVMNVFKEIAHAIYNRFGSVKGKLERLEEVINDYKVIEDKLDCSITGKEHNEQLDLLFHEICEKFGRVKGKVDVEKIESIVFQQIVLNDYKTQGLGIKIAQAIATELEKGET